MDITIWFLIFILGCIGWIALIAALALLMVGAFGDPTRSVRHLGDDDDDEDRR